MWRAPAGLADFARGFMFVGLLLDVLHVGDAFWFYIGAGFVLFVGVCVCVCLC